MGPMQRRSDLGGSEVSRRSNRNDLHAETRLGLETATVRGIDSIDWHRSDPASISTHIDRVDGVVYF